MRRQPLVARAPAEQTALDQFARDAFHLVMRYSWPTDTRISGGPICDEGRKPRHWGAAESEIAIVPRVQKYDAIVRPARINMSRKVITPIGHERAPGVRPDTGHRGCTRIQVISGKKYVHSV